MTFVPENRPAGVIVEEACYTQDVIRVGSISHSVIRPSQVEPDNQAQVIERSDVIGGFSMSSRTVAAISALLAITHHYFRSRPR